MKYPLPTWRRGPYAKLPMSVREALAAVIKKLFSGFSYWSFLLQLELDQSRGWRLAAGDVRYFSVERLLILLTRLGCDIEIRILPPQYVHHCGPPSRTVPRLGTVRVHDCTGPHGPSRGA